MACAPPKTLWLEEDLFHVSDNLCLLCPTSVPCKVFKQWHVWHSLSKSLIISLLFVFMQHRLVYLNDNFQILYNNFMQFIFAKVAYDKSMHHSHTQVQIFRGTNNSFKPWRYQSCSLVDFNQYNFVFKQFFFFWKYIDLATFCYRRSSVAPLSSLNEICLWILYMYYFI